MIRSLYTAATGMVAQQLNLDVIANNLANVNTAGFKKSRADFQDLMYQTIQEPGTGQAQQGTGPTGIQVGLGVRPAAVQRVYNTGDLQSTGNPLDIAIKGDGFFQVQNLNGELLYTRSGAFKMNEQGQLVTSDGYVLLPTITIQPEATSITVAEDGIVSVKLPGNTALTQVGQLALGRFQNQAGLRARGDNLFEETEASGAVQLANPNQNGFGSIAQGFLENSNVSVVEEIVGMVTGQRAYEANSKVIQTADQLLSQAVNLKR
jgi:flagellar basal-body rod protein FlgG